MNRAPTRASVHARADWPRIAGALREPSVPGERRHVIAEGWLDGAPEDVRVASIAGCACCTGQLALRVTLARLLRSDPPDRLFLVVADPAHVASLREALRDPQWAARLVLLEE